VLARAGVGPRDEPRPVRTGRLLVPLLAAAALAAAAFGAVLTSQRNQARREAALFQAEAATAAARFRDVEARLHETERRLLEATAFRDLVGQATTYVASLAGLPAASGSRARVVWNADRRMAVLLADGLPPAPPGKVYEAWVIASGAPVPAGVFRPDAQGRAVHALPALESEPRTFAVTLEPEGGTKAPTGPMVLAGPAI
jgi:hypothetical protein